MTKGTYVPANSLLKPLSGIAKTVDFAIAWYLKEHVSLLLTGTAMAR